jgi:hypothetical protein
VSSPNDRLVEVLGAFIEALIEFPTYVSLVVLVDRRLDAVPVEAIDGIAALAFAALATLLVRRTISQRERSWTGWGRFYRLPRGATAATASWAHLLVSALWLILGSSVGGRAGVTLVVMAGVLLVFRSAVIWWRRSH